MSDSQAKYGQSMDLERPDLIGLFLTPFDFPVTSHFDPFWQSDFEFQRIQTGDEAQRMFSDLVHLNAMLHALRTVNLPSNQFRGRTYIEQDNI